MYELVQNTAGIQYRFLKCSRFCSLETTHSPQKGDLLRVKLIFLVMPLSEGSPRPGLPT